MNSSPVGMPSRGGGIRDVVCTEANDWRLGRLVDVVWGAREIVRERMVSLRATSKPFRSSAGWGSCSLLAEHAF